MNDIGGQDSYVWRHIESTVKNIFESYGFHEIRTPIVEFTPLFKRSLGETSDAVEKEMYTFEDRSGDSLSLRPEGTASAVRAAIEHNWINESPILKMYYWGPMFRHERPQKGRYRQFYQYGVELLGVEGALADAEVMAIQNDILKAFGVEGVVLHLSSLGCDVCRPPYRQNLVEYFEPHKEELCGDCQRRLDKNPMRILDCKIDAKKDFVQQAPRMMQHLCADCDTHFQQVCTHLKSFSVEFKVDPGIVRGLDYYNRTAFEFIDEAGHLGAQATVGAGGRYDKLVEQLGGPKIPGVGYAAGVERLALLLESKKAALQAKPDLFVVMPDSSGIDIALKTTHSLRKKNFRIECDLQQKSMKSQLKRADKLQSRYVLILGQSELDKNIAILKNMADSQQQEIALAQLSTELEKILSLS